MPMTWKVTNSISSYGETLGAEYTQAGVLQCLKWDCDWVPKASHLLQSQEAGKLPQMKKKALKPKWKGTGLKAPLYTMDFCSYREASSGGWLEESHLVLWIQARVTKTCILGKLSFLKGKKYLNTFCSWNLYFLFSLISILRLIFVLG